MVLQCVFASHKMCSVSEATNNMKVLESAMDRLDIDNNKNDSIALRNDTTMHDALVRKFDISKSKVVSSSLQVNWF